MNPPRRWSRPGIAAGATAGEAFVANVQAALEQIDANARGAADGRDPDYLHQLRVGLRRLRATLRAFDPLVRRRKAAEFDHQLRAMLRALGGARDWDVFRRSHRDPGMLRAAQRRSTGARQRARAMVLSALFRRTPRSVLAWGKTAPWRSGADPAEPVAAFARGALRRLRDSLRKDAAGIDWDDAARRHRVRIKVKRLRYGCECFAAAYPQDGTRRFLKRLRTLQRILGALNDIAVQRRLLQELARDARLRRLAAASRAGLAARERVLTGALARAWVEFESMKPFWRRAAAVRVRG